MLAFFTLEIAVFSTNPASVLYNGSISIKPILQNLKIYIWKKQDSKVESVRDLIK